MLDECKFFMKYSTKKTIFVVFEFGLGSSFLCQNCFYYIDGAVPASKLIKICRSHAQATSSWDIYEIKTNWA